MKEQVRILIIGKGGKESAIAWKLRRSKRVEALWSAPGETPGCRNAEIETGDFDSVADFVSDNDIDMVIVGDERLIVGGITDCLRSKTSAKIIAPDAECARLEGSKEFAKEFMFENAIPTPRFMSVSSDTLNEGLGFLESLTPPYVLKADGLAEGKGVLIIDSLADAKDTLAEMIDGMFGNSSRTVIIEEFLRGRECTVMLALDGENYIILPVARDFKRRDEGDNGPNTAGMGAISPAPGITPEFMAMIEKRVIRPTLRGLREAEMRYTGFLYFGIIDVDGEPMVFEFNVRPGDPETEAVLPRIESDFFDVLEGIADGTLSEKEIVVSGLHCAAIVLAEKEYPASHDGSRLIHFLDEPKDGFVFEADVERGFDGEPYTAGGRVAVVSALGIDGSDALANALSIADGIEFDGKYYRRDIK